MARLFRRPVWTRRRFLAATVLLGATLAIALFVGSLSPLGKRGYERICLGMTIAEVEAALNVRPGTYRTDTGDVYIFHEQQGAIFNPEEYSVREEGPCQFAYVSNATGSIIAVVHAWVDRDNMINVITQDDRVVAKSYARSVPAYQVLFIKLRQKLGI